MIRQVMPEFHSKDHVVILCDSWYTKQNLVSIIDEYPDLDLISNARIDSVMYDLAPAQTGHRGRPAKHGKRLSVETDFTFSNEKIGDYYTGVRRVLAKIFGNREILAYVTATEKEHGTKRLFFSTIFPEDLQIFCAWQEKAPLNLSLIHISFSAVWFSQQNKRLAKYFPDGSRLIVTDFSFQSDGIWR